MKELKKVYVDEMEIVAEAKKVQTLIGSVRKIKGTKLYVMNTETGKIQLAKYKDVHYNYKGIIQHKVSLDQEQYKNQSVYFVQAINLKNAERKFKHYFLNKLK